MNDRPQHGAFSLNNLFPVVFIKYDADKKRKKKKKKKKMMMIMYHIIIATIRINRNK